MSNTTKHLQQNILQLEKHLNTLPMNSPGFVDTLSKLKNSKGKLQTHKRSLKAWYTS